MAERVFIGVAWPYANGSLHLGHVAGSLLPPDIFARYHRMRGREVLMVSGSDEHGTPITVTAERRGISPAQVAQAYHDEHVRDLARFGVSFDLFFRTSDRRHKEVVWDIFLKLLEKDLIYRKEVVALFCPRCGRFLPDRYVEGTCPHCREPGARGDQCDSCGKTLDPTELGDPACKICGAAPAPRSTEHFFLRLGALQPRLEEYLKDKDFWRPNVLNFTRNWMREGLRDRAITRDLQWGVEIPLPGYDTKRIYVWFEAVIGYLSTSKEWARRAGRPDAWRDLWQDPAVRHYYFLGKDNVPFHTIIWPSILLGYGGLNLPHDVPANEFLSFGGEKFSKSRGIGIELSPYLDRFDPDPMRYYLTINMPDNRDTDFTWEEFVRKNNDELVGTLGNFVNRVLIFTQRHFGMVPGRAEPDELDHEVDRMIHSAYDVVGRHLERCDFKPAMKEVMALAAFGNRLIDTKAPWKLIREDKTSCGGAMHVCLHLTKALCMLAYPFLPFTGRRLWRMLGEPEDIERANWDDGRQPLPVGRKLPQPAPLFRKLELDEVLGVPPSEGAPGKAAPPAPPSGPPPAPSMQPSPAKPATGPAKTAPPSQEPPATDRPAGRPQKQPQPSQPAGRPQKPAPHKPTAQAAQVPDPKESGAWFDRCDIRIGRILEVKPHPNADKLYITRVDLGTEQRQMVAGMKAHYGAGEMTGKLVATIVNLEPAVLRGAESAGMMFAFDEEGGSRIALVVPDGEARPGERVLALGRPPGTPAGRIGFKDFGRVEMRGALVSSVEGETASVEVPGQRFTVRAGPGFAPGRYIAVLMAEAPAALVTGSGVPLTREREIANGARVR
ncbi:MAG: methionine--tRNA ligase [Euryarchaeota archaeon]|nr:methionine--tRNA ligase [Euryarchaeota archaeon]